MPSVKRRSEKRSAFRHDHIQRRTSSNPSLYATFFFMQKLHIRNQTPKDAAASKLPFLELSFIGGNVAAAKRENRNKAADYQTENHDPQSHTEHAGDRKSVVKGKSEDR